MSKETAKALKVAEKFKKNSEKEMERIRALQQKAGRLASLSESMPVLSQFFDRVKQKELQASGDLIWIDQFLSQLRVQKNARAAAGAPEASGADGDKKKKSQSK